MGLLRGDYRDRIRDPCHSKESENVMYTKREVAPPEWPVFVLKLTGVTGLITHNFYAKTRSVFPVFASPKGRAV